MAGLLDETWPSKPLAHKRLWSAQLAQTALPPALGAARTQRSYLEENDDLKREGRERLWPYCLRLKRTAVHDALVKRAAQLTQEGLQDLDAPPPPFVDLGNFDPRRRLPTLERAPVAATVQRSLELGLTMQRDIEPPFDELEADRIRGLGHQAYLAKGVDVLAKRPGELSLAQVEAALRQTKRELKEVNRVNQAMPTDAFRIPIPKAYRDTELLVPLAPDLDGKRRPAPKVVMFKEGDEWKRRLAKPAPRHRRPPSLPFRKSMVLRDLKLARDDKERDRMNAENAIRSAREAERHLAQKAKVLRSTLRQGADAHERALDRLLANAAIAACRATYDDERSLRRVERREQLASLAKYRQEHLMECPHCGTAVVIAKLKEHQDRFCKNQARPCKNWAQGCKEVVRPMTAAWHECADHLLRPRSCLSLPGPCAVTPAYVAVDEEDLEPPWTAEFWIRRAPVEQPGGLLEGLARKTFKADALRRRLDQAVLDSQGKAQAIEKELQAFFGQTDAGGMTHDQVQAHQEELMAKIEAATQAETDRRVEACVARYTAKVLVRKFAQAVRDISAKPGALERTFAYLMCHDEAPPPPAEAVFAAPAPAPAPVPPSMPPPLEAQVAPVEDIDAEVPSTPCANEEDLRAAVDAMLADLEAKPVWDVPVIEKVESGTDSEDEKEALKKMNAKEKRKYVRQKKKQAVKKKRVKKREVVTGVESVETRVKACILAEDVANRGTDVLLACRDFRLCLDVPPTEEKGEEGTSWRGVPGMHWKGRSTKPFTGKSVPHETWLHVAFVCRMDEEEAKALKKPARAKLEVFVDGRSQGDGVAAPKNLELKLPMRDFGGDRDSVDAGFHGLLLEARYWKGARSALELVEYMHALPPTDRLKQGLIGWWTFEEGEGKHAFDRSELRYRSQIRGGWRDDPEKRVAWATPFEDEDPMTPASREVGVCQTELRLVRMANKAKDAMELIPCEFCGEQFIKSSMRAHAQNYCIFSEVSCDLCGKLVMFKDRRRHRFPKDGEAPECPQVAQMFALAARHEAGELLTECRLGCGLKLMRKERAKHEKDACRLRPVKCPNAGCGAMVAVERLPDHVHNFCEDPYFVARRRMIRKYRAIRKYARPWAANMVVVGDEDDSNGSGG